MDTVDGRCRWAWYFRSRYCWARSSAECGPAGGENYLATGLDVVPAFPCFLHLDLPISYRWMLGSLYLGQVCQPLCAAALPVCFLFLAWTVGVLLLVFFLRITDGVCRLVSGASISFPLLPGSSRLSCFLAL
jgi:hypothetical protein